MAMAFEFQMVDHLKTKQTGHFSLGRFILKNSLLIKQPRADHLISERRDIPKPNQNGRLFENQTHSTI